MGRPPLPPGAARQAFNTRLAPGAVAQLRAVARGMRLPMARALEVLIAAAAAGLEV